MIELRTLGSLDVRDGDGTPVVGVLAQPKRTALLVYLAVATAEAYVRRDSLLGMFWPEHDERRARGAMRQALYTLRQDLGPDVIATRGEDELRASPGALVCDVHSFDTALRAGELERAVHLYGGPFLAGFYLKGYREFEQWAEAERDRLASAYGKALEALVEQAAERRDWRTAVEWCRMLAKHNPYSTRVVLKYMEAMAAAGDRAGALQYAERHAARMREDLGAAPSPDVEALAERLRKEPRNRGIGPGRPTVE